MPYRFFPTCTGLRIYDFFLTRFPFIDDAVVDSDSENCFWSFIGLFLSLIKSRRL